MSGGGGGGRQVQTSEASFPSEFRPLATSAVTEIQELQRRLPLAQFAEFQPGGTAGISPLQRAAIEFLLPATLGLPSGTQALFSLAPPTEFAALGSAQAGAPTQGAQSALDLLAARLGSSPQLRSSQGVEQAFGASLPFNLPPPTAFPGVSPEQALAFQGAASAPVPVLGGPGPAQLDVTRPTPPSTFPPPFDTSAPEPQQVIAFFRGALDAGERPQFDQLVSAGLTPDAAFNQIIGRRSAAPPSTPADPFGLERLERDPSLFFGP